MNNIIYYPKIMVPSSILKKLVLYSDNIASIFPSHRITGDTLSDQQALADMQYLHDRGIFEYVNTDNYDGTLFRDLLEILTIQLNDNILRESRNRWNDNLKSYQIYTSKMNLSIQRFLIESGVAREGDTPESLWVEEEVAIYYMGQLANVICARKPGYIPTTSSRRYENNVFADVDKNQLSDSVALILRSLPSPNSFASMEDIIDFKSKYNKNLFNFKLFINDSILKLSSSNSENFEFYFKNFKDEYNYYCIELERYMNENRLFTLQNILEITLPSLAQIPTIKSTLPDFVLQASTAVTVSAITKKFQQTAAAKNALNTNPIAYLYHSANNGII